MFTILFISHQTEAIRSMDRRTDTIATTEQEDGVISDLL